MKEDDLILTNFGTLDYRQATCPVCGAAVSKPCFDIEKYTERYLKEIKGHVHLERVRKITKL